MSDSGSHRAWFLGLILPCTLVSYGLFCICKQSAFIPADGGVGIVGCSASFLHKVTGELAVAVGVACVGFGLFFHCEFWTPSTLTWRIYHYGKTVGLLLFVISVAYFIIRYTLTAF